jgi:type I restriction enzyme S subunit
VTLQLQLRHVFSTTSGATPDSGNPEFWDGDIPWATPEDVSAVTGYWLEDTRRRITHAGYVSCGTRLAPAKSIVLTKRAPIGQLAILATEACSNQGCFLLTPRNGPDARFFYYWLCANSGWLQILGRGSTFMELSTDDLKSLKVPLPSLVQQEAIADFLDRETARLDALVAAKEGLLKLSAEKRRALITRALTRGLNPSAPLRDSGIPWLGQIPAHWKVKRLKLVAEVRGGLTLGKNYGLAQLAEYPYLRVANVQDGRLDLSEVTTVLVPKSEATSCLLQAGDVLMNEGGDADKLGRGCVWQGEISPCLHQNHVFAVRPNRVSSEWLDLWTSTESAKSYFESRAKRSTNLASISGTNIKELPIPLPPVDERRAIRVHIISETAKLDALRTTAERTIVLLKERRAALIAAAVTGQLNIPEAG